MISPAVRIEWHPRRVPLTPVAVLGAGAAARALGQRLLALPEERLQRLRGVTGGELLVVEGEADDLPWVEGVLYLGRDPEAPSLLLPTVLEPSVPVPLVERMVRLRYPAVQPPVALVPQRALAASLAASRAVNREVLRAWLEAG